MNLTFLKPLPHPVWYCVGLRGTELLDSSNTISEEQWYLRMHLKEHVKGVSPLPLLCSGVATSRILCSALGFPVQERQVYTGENSGEGCNNVEGSGVSVICEKTDNPGTIQPGEEKMERGCYQHLTDI